MKCNKCGSISLHTEVKGNNTGLYCDNCGSWQKWLNKDEKKKRVFESSMRVPTKEEQEAIDSYIKSISKETGNDFYQSITIIERLQRFVKFLDSAIDKEFEKMPISPEDAIRKSSYCLALERDKNAIINIMNGKEFDYVE